jgi:hypothetical protein
MVAGPSRELQIDADRRVALPWRVKALARAFRWRKMLDARECATLEELARAKGIASSYVSRVLRLTLLAPDVVEAILVGRQPEEPGAVSRVALLYWLGLGQVPALLLRLYRIPCYLWPATSTESPDVRLRV